MINQFISRCTVVVAIVFAAACAEDSPSLTTIQNAGPSAPPPPAAGNCKVSKMWWEGKWYTARYDSYGYLDLLKSRYSDISFYYNNVTHLLDSADIFTESNYETPFMHYEYTQGPYGITQVDQYVLGNRSAYIIDYQSATRVNTLTYIEYSSYPSIAWQEDERFIYDSQLDNVMEINGVGTDLHTLYTVTAYDKMENPFKLLALSVGNPLFFPVGMEANFPLNSSLGQHYFGISRMNLFSANNPLKGSFELPGATPPEMQKWKYTVAPYYPTKITWTSYDFYTHEVSGESRYVFEYYCP